MKPIWKLLIAVVVVIALAVMLLSIPHYWAKASVNAYRAQLKKQGEKTTIAELTPPLSGEEIKAGQNFVAAARQVGQVNDWPPMMKLLAPGRALVGWSEPVSATELSSNCWLTLSAAVKDHRTAGETLSAALQGPAMGFSVDYSAGFLVPLTNLSVMRKSCLWLSAETMLAMHERNTNAAWLYLKAEANLVRMNHGEPLLISQLVRVAIGQIAVSTLWEALQYPGWTQAQLAELQTNWDSVDFLDHLETSFAMEQLMDTSEFENMRSSFSNYNSVLNPAFFGGSGPRYESWREMLSHPLEGIKLHMRYGAWKSRGSYEEELVTMQVWQAAVETARRVRATGAFVFELEGFRRAVANILKNHPGWENRFVFSDKNLFSKGDVEGVALNGLVKIASMENARRIAVTAIALDRFRLRHGQYPTELRELVSEYLPKLPIDLMDGKPLRYSRKENGTYLLYSVGINGKDDGGDGSSSAGNTLSQQQWDKTHDAVWPMPATPDEVKKYEAEIQEKLRENPTGEIGLPVALPSPAGTNSKAN